jgi:hypothetical protein
VAAKKGKRERSARKAEDDEKRVRAQCLGLSSEVNGLLSRITFRDRPEPVLRAPTRGHVREALEIAAMVLHAVALGDIVAANRERIRDLWIAMHGGRGGFESLVREHLRPRVAISFDPRFLRNGKKQLAEHYRDELAHYFGSAFARLSLDDVVEELERPLDTKAVQSWAGFRSLHPHVVAIDAAERFVRLAVRAYDRREDGDEFLLPEIPRSERRRPHAFYRKRLKQALTRPDRPRKK